MQGGRFASYDPLNDPPLGSLEVLHIEPDRSNVIERLAAEMVAFDSGCEQIQKPLKGPHHRIRAGNVLHQDQAPTRSEHAGDLADRCPVIRDGAQRHRADDRVECVVGRSRA